MPRQGKNAAKHGAPIANAIPLQRALLDLIASAPRAYRPEDAAFVTAYMDRGADPARRTMPALAWRSFAWFVSEPDKLVQMHDGTTAARKLAALL